MGMSCLRVAAPSFKCEKGEARVFLRRDRDDAVRSPCLQEVHALAPLITKCSRQPRRCVPARRTMLLSHLSWQCWYVI